MAADPPTPINWNRRLLQTAQAAAAAKLQGGGGGPYRDFDVLHRYRFGQGPQVGAGSPVGEELGYLMHTKVAQTGIDRSRPEVSKSSYYDTALDYRKMDLTGLWSSLASYRPPERGGMAEQGYPKPGGVREPSNGPDAPLAGSAEQPPPDYVFSRNRPVTPQLAGAASVEEPTPAETTTAPPPRTLPMPASQPSGAGASYSGGSASSTPMWPADNGGQSTSQDLPAWPGGAAIKANRPQYQAT
jgi:hypothetical protein